jgi:hypothetical protein
MNNKFYLSSLLVVVALICICLTNVLKGYSFLNSEKIDVTINRLKQKHVDAQNKIRNHSNILSLTDTSQSQRPAVKKAINEIIRTIKFNQDANKILRKLEKLHQSDSIKTSFKDFEVLIKNYQKHIKMLNLEANELINYVPHIKTITTDDLYSDYFKGVPGPSYKLQELILVAAVDDLTLNVLNELGQYCINRCKFP